MSLSILINSIQQNIFRIGGPILIIIGSIGSILNVIIFTKSTLRKNPCTICLITVNIVNFLYFYFGLLITTLANGYNIDPSLTNINFCRFRFYVAWVFTSWQSSCLILASIDRLLITSSNARTRKYSTHRLIITSLISIGLFWIIFHIHAFIFMDILEIKSNYFVCFFRPGIYTIFTTNVSLIINGSLPPLLMTIFGFLTVKNVRRIHRVNRLFKSTNIRTIVCGRPYTIQSKDRQLIRMLLVDIIAYVICKCPTTLFFMYQAITKYNIKTSEQEIIEQSILQLTFFMFFIENSISCYINVFVSRTFRREFKRIISYTCCFNLCQYGQ